MWSGLVTTSTPWRSNRSAVVALALLGSCAGPAVRGESIPRPTRYVEDRANVIDAATEDRLLGYLQELQQKTHAQFIVLTVPTTGGVPIKQFAFDLATRWKLGEKGKDNGLLLVVAVRDRKYDFETGYGLEGVLPDSFLGTVGRQYLVPNFRRGDYSRGIQEGVVAVLNQLAPHYGVELTGVPKLAARPARPAGAQGGGGPCAAAPCLVFLIALILLGSFVRRSGAGMMSGWWWLPIIFGQQHHHRNWSGGSGGGWGGGSGGGGFGSFGGGGGGSFGGGGASGGW
jgi:uncharacterized protein